METQDVSSNPQATPDVQPPAASGSIDANLAARVAELEKSNEGRLRDLQEERRKRQELEQRLQSVPASPAVQNPGVEQDEVAKALNPYIAPTRQMAEEALKIQKELMARQQEDQALSYLSEKTGKTKTQLLADVAFQEKLSKVAQKWGFRGAIHEVTQRAYEAMELEDFRAQQTEKARAAQASTQASLPAGAPPKSSGAVRRWKRDEFSQFNGYSVLEKTGTFSLDKETNEIVYTPRS
jgi:hypothetical protein